MRALRKAVSPDVIGQAITPIIAIAPPTFPRRPVHIAYTDFEFPPPMSSRALRPVPVPSLFQKNAIAADAQTIAIMPSATIAP